MTDFFNNLKNRTPYNAKLPEDMLYYSNLSNHFPISRIPPPGIHKWLSEHEARKSINYKEFSYNINDIGFRDDYPGMLEPCIGYFGCSCTFGEGLPTEETFFHIISNELGYRSLNLGMLGTGVDRIHMTFAAAANIWNIKIAVITLPNHSRISYTDKNGEIVNINPPNTPSVSDENKKLADPIRIQSLYTKHFNNEYFYAHAKDHIQGIINVAKLNDIKLILGTWSSTTERLIQKCFNYNSIMLDHGDKARDNLHPGKISNKQYAEEIIENIKDEKFFE